MIINIFLSKCNFGSIAFASKNISIFFRISKADSIFSSKINSTLLLLNSFILLKSKLFVSSMLFKTLFISKGMLF